MVYSGQDDFRRFQVVPYLLPVFLDGTASKGDLGDSGGTERAEPNQDIRVAGDDQVHVLGEHGEYLNDR